MPRLPRKNPLNVVSAPFAPPQPTGDPAPLSQQVGAQVVYMGGLTVDPDLPSDGVSRLWYRVDAGQLRCRIDGITYVVAPGTGVMIVHGDAYHTPVYEKQSNKGAASGYPSLNAGQRVLEKIERVYSGTAAQRPAGPAVGDAWVEEDTSKLCVCFSAGVWTEVGSGGGGGGHVIQESGVPAPAEPALNFLGGFDVIDVPGVSSDVSLDITEAPLSGLLGLAGAQTITGEKLINSTTGLRFGNASGPIVAGGAAGDKVTLTGRLGVTKDSPAASDFLLETVATGTFTGSAAHTKFTMSGCTLGNYTLYGLYATGIVPVASGSTLAKVYGLWFQGFVGGGGTGTTVPYIAGGYFRCGPASFTGTITEMAGVRIQCYVPSGPGATIALTRCLHIEPSNSAYMTNVEAIKVDDSTSPTGFVHLLEIGPSTPYLRVVGKAAPGAGLTHLWLYEGTTPQLRNVGFAVADAGGHVPAGAKILYLV